MVAGAQRWSHLLRQLVVRVLAGKTGSHNGVLSSAGDWSVVWMNMVLALPTVSKTNGGLLRYLRHKDQDWNKLLQF